MGIRTLQVSGNDFIFSNNRLTQITGIEALAQIIGNRLKLGLGESFANVEAGVDWIGLFNLDKNVPIEKRARVIIRNAINADPNIIKINELNITFDNSTREAIIDFKAETTEGLIANTVII